nr:MAG TPA: hypothetical protein [Caudoviricetes sp.]
MVNSINIDGKMYYKISETDLIQVYNKSKSILWLFETDYGLDKIIFSKRSELGNVIIEHIKFFIEMKTKFEIQFSTKYFYFVQI